MSIELALTIVLPWSHCRASGIHCHAEHSSHRSQCTCLRATVYCTPPDVVSSRVSHVLRCAQAAGLSVDQVAPRLSFFFAVGLNFYEEVAKLRAARRLWARMVKDRFAPNKESSLILRWVGGSDRMATIYGRQGSGCCGVVQGQVR